MAVIVLLAFAIGAMLTGILSIVVLLLADWLIMEVIIGLILRVICGHPTAWVLNILIAIRNSVVGPSYDEPAYTPAKKRRKVRKSARWKPVARKASIKL